MNKNTKHLFIGILLGLVIYLFMYLLFAFVMMEYNPAKWDALTRGLLAFFSAILSTLCTGIYFDNKLK